MRRFHLLTALTLFTALLVTACGDDGPTREEFAQSANEICRDLERSVEGLGEPSNVEEISQFADRARSRIDQAIERMDGLETPSGEDGERAEEFVSSLKTDTQNQIRPALDDLSSAAESGDEQALVRAAERVQNVETDRSDRLAREIGADACAD
jgi:hypothetical protein